MLGRHQRELGVVRVVARWAGAALAVSEPEAGREPVNARAPVAEFVSVAGAAKLVGFVEAHSGAVGQVEVVDVVR